MSTRLLSVLALGTLVVVGLALMPAHRGDELPTAQEQRRLLPGLPERINEIEELELVAPDGDIVASLHRDRGRWRIRQMHSYEADFARIHDLLRDLAQARRLEPKTDNPEWYGRLGVADPGPDSEGAGVLVRFPGTDLPSVLVGKVDPAGLGRYARLAGEARSWLIDRDPELSAQRLDWVEVAVMDIPAGEIESVSVRRPGGERLELRPGDEDGSTWVLLDAPPEREVRPAWRLRENASALARLRLQDVRPHDAQEALPASAVETVFRTVDGMIFTATTFSDDDGDWVHFRVTRGETESDSQDSSDAAAEAQSDSPGAEIDIVAVDGRLSPWQFALPQDRFKRFRPTLEDLLVAAEDASD